MRASIIIAGHNEGEAILKTIESCIETSAGLDYEFIVVDDASTDHSIEQVASRFSQVRIYRHPSRLGASPTKAFGARNARGEVVVFLDGHSKPEYGAITRLVDDVASIGEMAVVTPAVAGLDERRWKTDLAQVGHGYSLDLLTLDCGWLPLHEMRKIDVKGAQLYESPSLIGCALAMSRELYDKLWGFDPNMFYWGVEDLDFGLKCWLMGHRILHDPRAVVGHRFRSTFHNYVVPLEHPLVNQMRMARKNFGEAVWREWLERCRERHQGGLPGRPEGLWARAWHLFESGRPSVEQERSYLHGHRTRDEFWFAERFGLAWPRLESAVSRDGLKFFLGGSPSPHPSPSPAPAVLQILDRKTGSVISHTTLTRIIGQKIQLQVRVQPTASMTAIQWTIPGTRIKNYTQSATTAVRTALSGADLQNPNVDLYWITGGTFTVQVAATVGGHRLTTNVTYKILVPTGLSMTSVTGTVAVSDPGFPPPHLELHFGSTTTPGISWTFQATAPAGGAGQIAATQLVNTVRTQTPNGAAVQTLSSGGTFVLDTHVPYAAPVAIAAGTAATWTANDTPGQGLTPAFTQVTVQDNFQIYFMYRPAGADSIWVTIGLLSWHWGGQTTRAAAPPPNNWGAATGVGNSTNPPGGASSALPVWTANVTSLAFH